MTPPAADPTPGTDNTNGRDDAQSAWLELPAETSSQTAAEYTYYVDNGATRNYTMYYDKATYTPLWVAYPMKKAYDGEEGATTYSASWSNNPDIDDQYEVSVWEGSYNVPYTQEGFNDTSYNRGHMIPDASRDGNQEMVKQAYYATNSVPQIQDGFNGGIWATIEGTVRGEIKESSYELYVVTGAVFQTVGGNETITYINPGCDSSKSSIPVANYFYKVVLKARVGSDGTVTAASTVGFWIEHKRYSGVSATGFNKSVDEIEALTGMDFFVNLPDTIEASAETNNSWSAFQSF